MKAKVPPEAPIETVQTENQRLDDYKRQGTPTQRSLHLVRNGPFEAEQKGSDAADSKEDELHRANYGTISPPVTAGDAQVVCEQGENPHEVSLAPNIGGFRSDL
jgi:hypothetical protein